MNSIDASYPIVDNQSRSVRNVITNEIFKIVEQYIGDSGKLLIDSIEHKSPGGVKFRTPKPIKTRRPDKLKDEVQELTPLEKTGDSINEMFNQKSSDGVVKEIIVQYRTKEPDLMHMFSDILSNPLGNILKLINSHKIGQSKILKISKYGENETHLAKIT
jgi:hypothetical protein